MLYVYQKDKKNVCFFLLGVSLACFDHFIEIKGNLVSV